MTKKSHPYTFLLFSVYIFFYLIFYPPTYAFRDEANYFSAAYMLRQGVLDAGPLGFPLASWIVQAGQKLSDYPLGMSLSLIPATFLGWKAVFITPLLFHLAGAWYFQKTLPRLKIPREFFILYLFYPPFVLYSRTIMSDVPAASLFVIGLYYYLKNSADRWKAGLWWGISLFFRDAQIVYLLPFFIASSLRIFRSPKNHGLFLLTSALFLGLQMAVRYSLWGNCFGTGYDQRHSIIQNFSASYFWPNALFYLAHLNLVYPLMLPLALLGSKNSRRIEFYALVVLSLLFFSFYFYRDQFHSASAAFFFGGRFLFPASALLLYMFADFLQQLFFHNPAHRAIFLKAALTALIVSTIAIHFLHQNQLAHQERQRRAIYESTTDNSVLIYDQNTAEFMQKAWGERTFLYERDAPAGSWLKILNRLPFSDGVYLRQKGEGLGPRLAWVAPEEMEASRPFYRYKKIQSPDPLEVYQIVPS